MKTILVPVDFSAATNPVITAAAALAKALKARVVLLHCVRPPSLGGELSPDAEKLIETAEHSALGQLAACAQAMKDLGLEAEAVSLYGPPAPMIEAEIARLAPDHIVMGSHGHTALPSLLVGSTARGVLRSSPCPVTIVPASREAVQRASGASASSEGVPNGGRPTAGSGVVKFAGGMRMP
jgi:nucleotide-binding universal stress UspA family protein